MPRESRWQRWRKGESVVAVARVLEADEEEEDA